MTTRWVGLSACRTCASQKSDERETGVLTLFLNTHAHKNYKNTMYHLVSGIFGVYLERWSVERWWDHVANPRRTSDHRIRCLPLPSSLTCARSRGSAAQLTQKPRCNILLLGIERSGKTAWLDCVRAAVTRTGSRPLARFVPTVGQNGMYHGPTDRDGTQRSPSNVLKKEPVLRLRPTVLDLSVSSAVLHFWDLGGDASLRRLWARYCDDADVLVYAMDARDWLASVEVSQTEGEADGDEDIEGDWRHTQKDTDAARERRRDDAWATLGEIPGEGAHNSAEHSC